jgi:hypothetical protein
MMKVRMSVDISLCSVDYSEALTFNKLANATSTVDTDVQVPILIREEPLQIVSDFALV